MTTMKKKIELEADLNDTSKGKGSTSRESTPSRILPLKTSPTKTPITTPLSNRFSVLAKVPTLPSLSQFPPLSPGSSSSAQILQVQPSRAPSTVSNTSTKLEVKENLPSRYYTKICSQKICLLPNHPSEELDARSIAGQHFPIGFYWCPSDPRKNYAFYKKKSSLRQIQPAFMTLLLQERPT
ncbi:hypothetical protein Dimus_038305 [Dionaea muscipula]